MKSLFYLFFFIFILLPLTSFAITGKEAAFLMGKAQKGYIDSDLLIKLETIGHSGKKRRKHIHIKQKEHVSVSDGVNGEASLLIFSPKHCTKSMAVLTIETNATHIKQWMFLPALKKVRTISASSRGGTLAGSEFSYEELTSHSSNNYRYEREVETITFNGHTAWQFIRFPKGGNSQYSKQQVIIDANSHLPYQINYYDHKGELLKTLTLEDYRNIGGIMHFKRATMLNHQNNNRSVITVLKDYVGTGLSSQLFDPLYLKQEMVKNRCIR